MYTVRSCQITVAGQVINNIIGSNSLTDIGLAYRIIWLPDWDEMDVFEYAGEMSVDPYYGVINHACTAGCNDVKIISLAQSF